VLVKLAEALKRQSHYLRNYYTPTDSEERHVILTGHATVASVHEFVTALFHEDAGEHQTAVVILAPEEPSPHAREACSTTQATSHISLHAR